MANNTKAIFSKTFSYIEEKHIKTKEYDKAIEAFKKEGFFNSEKEFLSYLKPSQIKTTTYDFLKTFKQMNWNEFAKELDYDKFKIFLNYTTKEKLPLDITENNWSLLVKILSLMAYDDSKKYEPFLLSHQESIQKAFLDEQKASSLIAQMTEHNIKALNKCLKSDEIVNSKSYQKYVLSDQYFRSCFLNKYNIALYDEESLPKNMQANIKSIIASTQAVAKLSLLSYYSDAEQEKSILNLLKNPKFSPDISLLSEEYKTKFQQANFLVNKVTQYYNENTTSLLKSLIENNFINPADLKLSDVSANIAPLAEKLLLNRIHTYNTGTVLNVDNLIKELSDLKTLGIELNINKQKLDILKERKEINDNRPHHSRSMGFIREDIEKDIYEFSMENRFPPKLMKNLVEFFDKRYGHNLENQQNNEEKKNLEKEQNEKKWETLLSMLTVVENEVNNEEDIIVVSKYKI